MDALVWRRIGELLEAARELDEKDRVEFLREQCGDDRSLFRQVLFLLNADNQQPPLDSRPTASALPIPDVVAGRFRIVRYIAEGGMGTVYEAEDFELHDRVALKTIRPEIAHDTQSVERFKREILLAKSVTHPNVCRVHDLVIDCSETGAQVLYLSMQYLHGETLASRIRRGPLPATEALPLIEDMSDGLSAAHQAGVVHRDFKSGNIILVRRPDRTHAVITDFGLARAVHGSDIRSFSRMVGTVPYMSPEQIRGDPVTPSSDVYSLGVVMYEMVTGQRPFLANTNVAVAMKHLHDEPQPPRNLVPYLEPNWNDAILRCLRKDPAQRFQSTDEVKLALHQTHQGQQYSIARLRSRIERYGIVRAMVLMAAVIALAVGTIVLVKHYRTNTQPITSVAVLPIGNRTGNPELNYLSGGITAALTNDLSQVSGLTVTAESSASRVAEKTSDPRSASHELGVETIVTGWLTTDGPLLLLRVELVDANTGSLIWGETLSRPRGELAAMQEDVARELAYRLRIRLEGDVAERLRRQYQTNSAAYDAYLKGKYALRERSPSGFESALVYFQQSIDHDSQYAPAFAGLADSYCLMAYNRIPPTITLLEKCKEAANRALHIDSTLAEAYTSLAAAVTLLDFDWRAAEDMYRRSIQLNPNYLPAHVWYGLILLTPLGRHSEAMAQMEYALRADPDALTTHLSLSVLEYYSQDYDAAITELERIKQQMPSFSRADEFLVEAYLAKNMPAEAVRLVTQSRPSSDESRELMAIALGIAYAKTGKKQLALKQLSDAQAALKRGDSLYYEVAELCAALGYNQKALDYLDKALSARQPTILFVNVDPMMEPLRSDERFRQLLSALHLT